MKKQLLLFLTTALSLLPHISQAQTYTPSNRTPQADGSIGTTVTDTGAKNFNITGGLQRGQNLFHSFTDFSIPTGGAANFTNPVGNQSIITRVTGNFISDINGTLNSNGANFLLINPNGVVFGTNARLDVGKAFVTSTANGIDFVDAQGQNYNFGVNRSGDAPLLTIDPNVAFNPARLIIGGTIPGSKGIENYGTLQTKNPGQYIGLIGGDVTFNSGQIIAPGAKVELGGLVQSGTVGVSLDNGAQFPANVDRGNVSLMNQAKVDVAGAGGGNIAIDARNVEILAKSQVRSGIAENLGTAASVAGDIKFNATGEIFIVGSSTGIVNQVGLNSRGQAGNITLDAAGSLFLRDGAQVGVVTLGQGNAGNVQVVARNTVSIVDNGGIFSSVESGGVGKGGNIDITAGSLSLLNGGQLITITRGASATQPAGKGNAGNVNMKVSGAIDLAGTKNGFRSGVVSFVDTGTIGNSGNITIDAGSLSLRDGAIFFASTFGQGNAGNVKVATTGTVSVVDNANIFSTVESGGVGKGGNIDITAGSLSLLNGGQLITITRGASATQPAGKGDAGNVNVKVAGAANLAGKKNGFESAISSSIGTGSVGKGGNITIDAGSVSLSDEAKMSASTLGQGNSGNITVTAKDTVSLKNSGILSTVAAGAIGNGGNINITSGSLYLSDAAQVLTTTRGASATQPAGKGNAGNVNVKVSGAADIVGRRGEFGSVISSVLGTGTVGNAGNITIDANSFSLYDGAQILSSTFGEGNAGNITVKANDFVIIAGNSDNFYSSLLVNSESLTGGAGNIIVMAPRITVDSGSIDAQSLSGNGGNINIQQADLLLLRRGGQITTNAGGTPQLGGNGGNINIDSKLIVAIPNENSHISANAVKGRGGNVNINTQGLFGIQFRPNPTTSSDITASSDFGQSGNVQINTPGIDPGKDTGELPAAPNDASNQISQTCGASQRENKFYITGRGGLPQNASEPQESEALWQDAREVKTKPATTTSQPPKIAPPAIGWVFQKDGRVRLIAAQTAGGATGTKAVCPGK